MYAPVSKGLVHPFQTFGGLGQDGNAAYRAVQPVRDAHEDLAGFAIPAGDEGLIGIGQCFVAGFVALDDFAAAFVHHEQVVVFVQDAALKVAVFLF